MTEGEMEDTNNATNEKKRSYTVQYKTVQYKTVQFKTNKTRTHTHTDTQTHTHTHTHTSTYGITCFNTDAVMFDVAISLKSLLFYKDKKTNKRYCN